MTKKLIQFLLISVAVSGCTSMAYYQSPLQANASAYKPIPTQKDSMQTATYVNAAFATGGANVYYQDGNNSCFIQKLGRVADNRSRIVVG